MTATTAVLARRPHLGSPSFPSSHISMGLRTGRCAWSR